MNRTMTSIISMGIGAAATYAMSGKRMNTRKMKKNWQRQMKKMF
ncbi:MULTISPECIES: DUF3918 family protein [Bacillaceae]|uniref:DUF3918 family protein n=2 Tax=Metabacillus TaxID=2675233 RepID=A0ABS5LGI2_9BACI|nr:MULTISPECIES: DUF3918 family protein [Bacillaceae]MBS2969802.1 DUF3918 family protein [Metabacillus flavus]